jgi:hypothetical protein
MPKTIRNNYFRIWLPYAFMPTEHQERKQGYKATHNKRRELKTSANSVCDRPDRAIKCPVNANLPGSPNIRFLRSILRTPIRSPTMISSGLR